ncbi:50S ribosomal protein L1 [Candidatus Saccharibacteria bacterium]|nr:50S ribosomal protein L1 [Candidatus Saccharibacteria bacterium]
MAKTKQELLNEADKLGLALSVKNTVAEIQAAIESAQNAAEEDATAEKQHYAKSGKRSLRHEEEVQAQEEKEARKAAGDTTPQGDAVAEVKKGPAPKTRPLAERHGKNYKKVAAKVDRAKFYSLAEALQLATETCPVKFDSTVEIHVRLGVDPKQADQNIRATVSLPNGTGKAIRVAAFVPETDVEAAKKSGADIAGEEVITKLLDKETIDFDVLIATPQLMPKLSKYARLLGPRGLMPNPKAGTVSAYPAQAVKEAKTGKVEYRVDKQSIVHLGIGKVSFGAAKLEQNANVFLSSLTAAKPSSLKGAYILSIAVSTTMGPGIKVANS